MCPIEDKMDFRVQFSGDLNIKYNNEIEKNISFLGI